MKRHTGSSSSFRYKRDIGISLACILGLMIALVHLWPAPSESEPDLVYRDLADDPIQVDEIPASRQPQAPPPPPVPLPPIEVPDATELEDLEIDFTAEFFDDEWEDDTDPPAPEGASYGSPSPEVAARQLRLVEPAYSQEARRSNIRAQVTIEVLVDESGDVREAEIREMMLLDENNRPKEHVSELGYGLEEAALDAARRTTFAPAQADGSSVQSRTTITIRFGV